MATQTADSGVLRAARIAQVRTLTADGSAKLLRKSAHLSLGDVGRALGVSAPTVWRWEEGMNFPRPDVAVRYGELLTQLLQIDPSGDPE